jgi:hypothetical protein
MEWTYAFAVDGCIRGRRIVPPRFGCFGDNVSRGIQIQERARGGREPRYHHYVFELFALDRELDLPPTAGRAEPLAAMNGNVIAKAAYVARFRRAH